MNYNNLVGREFKVWDLKAEDFEYLGLWDGMFELVGSIGIIDTYDENDHSFRILFSNNGSYYWFPGEKVLENLIGEYQQHPNKEQQLTDLFNQLLDTLDKDNTIPNEVVITNKQLFISSWKRELNKILNG